MGEMLHSGTVLQNLSEHLSQSVTQLDTLSDAMDLMLDSDMSLDDYEHSKDPLLINMGEAEEETFEAYIGAELYSKRMFPHGCPSYQKAFVKLFKVENVKGVQKMKLVDTQFFDNRQGFGFMYKHLAKGDYQIQFKKYSPGFDVFDFTVRMYSGKEIKLIDEEVSEIQKVKLTKEQIDKIPKIGAKKEVKKE